VRVVVGLLDHRAVCSVVIGRFDGANWSRKNPVRRPAGLFRLSLCR
jgi:hypothetical protein